MLSPDLRFPDGSFNDFLSYFIWLCDDGLFQVIDPLGEELELADTYEIAKAFWRDAQRWRDRKSWYRNLSAWLNNRACTREELGILVLERRLTKLGIIALRESSHEAGLKWLGRTALPNHEQVARLTALRKQLCAEGTTAGEILAALRTVERHGA